jgi:NAD(P)-dependent dehydrogenase (short-subunit alcohol dehydrogenase family)
MIIIIGVTGGIGNFLFEHYSQLGESLIGTYHLNKPVGEIYESTVSLDITDYEQVEKFIQSIAVTAHPITLINCAGVSANAFAHKSNVEDWKQVINVNLIGAYHLIRAALPVMRTHNFGRIINLSSIVSETGVMGTSAYAASKAGINGMIKSMALENGQKGITINNINLGYFKVGMINTVPKEMQEAIKLKIAANEFGDPQHIFSTIEYIRNTPYLNGACVDLNGGLV